MTSNELSALADRVEGATGRCTSCDDTGDLVRIDGEWMGYCNCEAGLALRALAKDNQHG